MDRAAPDRFPRLPARARSAVGAVILVVLLVRVGPEPFVTALTGVTWPALLAALVITAVTTACCAWRWSAVAAALGVRIGPAAAIGAYYRSQFLNSTLPGGVLGDVHRAVRHGLDAQSMGRGIRSVVWERVLGQVVQVVLTVVVLLVLPTAVPALLVVGVLAVVAAGAGIVLVRVVGVLGEDLRRILHARRTLGIVLTSCVAVLGHVTVLLVAMAATGVDLPLGRRVALAFVVLLGAAIPASIAGWGPREGVAAWAFEIAGPGAAAGVGVAVLYGVLALVATLPGAALLLLGGGPGPRKSLGSCEGGGPGPRKSLGSCEGGGAGPRNPLGNCEGGGAR